MSVSTIFFMLAAVLALTASAFHIWRMRRCIRRMREVIETFDLGDFEGRLAQAGGGGGQLAGLAAAVSNLTSALFAGASTVSTTASSTIAEKEAQTHKLREVFVTQVRGVLDRIGSAVTGIQNTASSMLQLAGETESYSTQIVPKLKDATRCGRSGSRSRNAEQIHRRNQRNGGVCRGKSRFCGNSSGAG